MGPTVNGCYSSLLKKKAKKQSQDKRREIFSFFPPVFRLFFSSSVKHPIPPSTLFQTSFQSHHDLFNKYILLHQTILYFCLFQSHHDLILTGLWSTYEELRKIHRLFSMFLLSVHYLSSNQLLAGHLYIS